MKNDNDNFDSSSGASLSKLLPLTAIFGDESKNNFSVRQIVGLSQRESDPNVTEIHYLGDNVHQQDYFQGVTSWGNSIKTQSYRVNIKDVFNMMVDAFEKGEIVDLTHKNLSQKGVWQSKETQPEPKKQKGFIERVFG
jgi:hypothetical protein